MWLKRLIFHLGSVLPSSFVFTSNAAKFNLYAAFVGPSSKNNYPRNTWTWNLKTDCLNFFLSQIGTFLFFFRFFDPKNKESRIFFNPEKIATNRKLCQKLKNSENREILIFLVWLPRLECLNAHVCVYVCIWAWACVCVRLSGWDGERDSVCVWVCLREQMRKREEDTSFKP